MKPVAGLGGYGRGGGPISADSTCRHCGMQGHFARECPRRLGNLQPGVDDEAGAVNFIRSQRVAAERIFGDQDRDRNVNETPGNADEQRRQPVTYRPLESNLDQLWNQRIAPGANFDRMFASEVGVEVSGGDTNTFSIEYFEDAGLTPQLLENVKRSGYEKPTPIQQHAIPLIAQGRDVMACAQTGSGKTAAYLLPILSSMLTRADFAHANGLRQEPACVVVTPTRELAVQVKDEARKFAAGTGIGVVVIYGGTSVHAQNDNVQRGCNVLVATPGRLMQFVDEGRICLRRCRYLVLDEADRMLDMGFEPTIRRLIELPEMPPKGEQRQTLMFSATFPPEIQNLAQEFMNRYVFLTVGKLGGANEDITQSVLLVQSHEKYDKLYELLVGDGGNAAAASRSVKTLIFVERKRVADFVASRVSQMGLSTTSIHGDREQREREEALRDFKTGRCPVLVATAVASRGLDIMGVDHVINFDLPSTIDDYVHRIGRTGRVGNLGKATSFYDPRIDSPLAANLVKILLDAKQEVPEWLLSDVGTGGGDGNTASGGKALTEEPW